MPTSLFGSATRPNKPVNEDAVAHLSNETADFRAVLVADGLGSFSHAAEASALAVESLKSKLAACPQPDSLDFAAWFGAIQREMAAQADGMLANGTMSEPESALGTTLIGAVETTTQLHFAYVGNGAILHLRGDFNGFSAGRVWPWNVVNHLSPHTVEENGREALFRLLSNAGPPDEALPTVLSVNKDSRFGDIVLICSDGIYSQDQVRMGRNSTGTWLRAEDKLLAFYEQLNLFFKNLTPETANPEALQTALTHYLQSLTIDDDASVGLLITETALVHQLSRNPALPS